MPWHFKLLTDLARRGNPICDWNWKFCYWHGQHYMIDLVKTGYNQFTCAECCEMCMQYLCRRNCLPTCLPAGQAWMMDTCGEQHYVYLSEDMTSANEGVMGNIGLAETIFLSNTLIDTAYVSRKSSTTKWNLCWKCEACINNLF